MMMRVSNIIREDGEFMIDIMNYKHYDGADEGFKHFQMRERYVIYIINNISIKNFFNGAGEGFKHYQREGRKIVQNYY